MLPSKHSLDEAFPNRPVALYSGDAHTLWLNSCALAELGIDRDSVPPAGGSYDRDADGDLTGIVREAAAMELMPRIMNAFSDDEIADAYRGFAHVGTKRHHERLRHVAYGQPRPGLHPRRCACAPA